jgi:hypothetical protein
LGPKAFSTAGKEAIVEVEPTKQVDEPEKEVAAAEETSE